MRNVIAAVMLAALAPPMVARAQSVVERFDQLPEQTVVWGQPLVLEHFRVEVLGDGRDVAIKPTAVDDDIAAGMVLGVPGEQSLSTVYLHFNRPWQRVDITFVVPPTDTPVYSIAMLYGATEHPYSMTLQHTAAGHRARISLSQSAEIPFTSLLLHLQHGAQVDNIELR